MKQNKLTTSTENPKQTKNQTPVQMNTRELLGEMDIFITRIW
jgi:hypothetical protein